MTSVEAPVLCLQKQPDQTRTPRRCPESQARTTENKNSTRLYQTGVAHVDHKTALHPENAAALKFFPNSASRSGQKLRINRNTEVEGFTYVDLAEVYIRSIQNRESSLEMSGVLGQYKAEESGLGVTILQEHGFLLIPVTAQYQQTPYHYTISPQASLLHSFQCLWAHNPDKDLQRTIPFQSHKKNTPQFPVAFWKSEKKNTPEVSSNDLSKPELNCLGFNHKLSSDLDATPLGKG